MKNLTNSNIPFFFSNFKDLGNASGGLGMTNKEADGRNWNNAMKRTLDGNSVLGSDDAGDDF